MRLLRSFFVGVITSDSTNSIPIIRPKSLIPPIGIRQTIESVKETVKKSLVSADNKDHIQIYY